SPADGSYNSTGNVTVQWTTDDMVSGIAEMAICVDGGSWTIVWETSYSLIGLNDGSHTVAVKVTDNVGNFNETSVSFIVDTTAPTVTITSPADGSYNSTGNVTVQWTTDDDDGIAYYDVSIDDGSWITVNGTSYMFNDLDDGIHTVIVRAYDVSGNYDEASVNIMVDTMDPVITIISPSEGSYLNSSSVTVQWTASDDGGIAHLQGRVDDGAWHFIGPMSVSAIFNDLQEGEHTVDIEVIDLAGNVMARNVTFVVDTVVPTITVSPTGNGVSPNAAISVTFSETMNVTSVHITVDGISGILSWDGDTATLTPSEAMAFDTTYTVVVSGEDLAGNSIDEEWSFATLKDEGAISGTVTDENGNALENATVALSSGETVTTDVNGHFMFVNITSGSNTLTIAKDGYEGLTRNVTVSIGQTTDLGDLSVDTSSSASDDSFIMIITAILAIIVLLVIIMLYVRRKKKIE
ncbi:MAG: Ig-like domain-containing protein, partial [Methanomassiliicoccales archaeon]|nr:Ig-like domain-containing protein [Methanomassiliicoccales archaeon]